MTNEQAQKVLNELQGVRPEVLNGEAKRLFEAIMKIADERDELKNKVREKDNRIKQLENMNKFQSKDIKEAVDYTFELNKEIELKDKIIDLMAEKISESIINTCPLEDYNYDLDCENKCNDDYKECWKQYFANKVKEVE